MYQIMQADVSQGIPLRDKTVQCVVTSPPYWGLRDYGLPPSVWADGWRGCLGLEPTPELYVEHMVQIFRDVRRVLKDDGVLFLNLGDSYSDKQLVGIPWRVAFALQADGWWLRSDIIWHKPNPMPESVTDRPTKAHEYMFLLTKSARYFYDQDAIREANQQCSLDRYNSGAPMNRTVSARDLGVKELSGNMKGAGRYSLNPAGRNRRTVWTIATTPYKEAHFATFPPALIEPCILAGSALGDVVLDPFNGSGTTGAVCREWGRDYIGLELNMDYIGLAEERIGEAQPRLIF